MPRTPPPTHGRQRSFLLVTLALAIAGLPAVRAQEAPAPGPQSGPDGPAAAGTGVLLRRVPGGFAALPALDMTVDLRVTGIMVQGTVWQTFRNSTTEVIEAIYVFPLPERAAVDSMEMQVGERRIRSVVREREAARAAYETARQEGRKAGLLEQRPSRLFTTSVANINPGETIEVRLDYVEEVTWEDGHFGLAFPLTWTPRFTPRATPEDGTAAAAPGTGEGGCFVEATHPAAPRARIRARLEGGLPLGPITSPSHPIRLTREATTAWVEVGPGDVTADRDFVLQWEVRGGAEANGAVFVEDSDDGRYALVMLVPPVAAAGAGLPTRTLFIVDVSGSMDGPSIEQARQALLAALDRLRPEDSFNIIQFNDRSAPYRDGFEPAVPSRLAEARTWVRGLRAAGGTEILAALRLGMRLTAADGSRQVKRIVLITDGAVNGEEEMVSEVTRALGDARLNVVGIGAAPNRPLMRRIARAGRGSCEFIVSLEEVEERIDAFLRRIDRPVLADPRLDWDGAPPLDSYPGRLPDLHAGEPLFVSLRLGPSHPGTRARLTGWTETGSVEVDLAVPPDAPRGAGIATRWARARVDELLDGLHEGADPDKVREQIVGLATRFNLVTRFTSLVAVEETPTAAGPATAVAVANALPPGGLQDGALPQGATSGPLLLRVGLLLVLLGAAVVGLARHFAF